MQDTFISAIKKIVRKWLPEWLQRLFVLPFNIAPVADTAPDTKESVGSTLFHTYDIRGQYPQELNEQVFRQLADAFCTVFEPSQVVIGRDSRTSSLELARALGRRLQERGVDVIDAEHITTPQATWIAREQAEDVLMVTASHNPPSYNGLKLFSKNEGPVHYDNFLPAVEQAFLAAEKANETVVLPEEPGTLMQRDYTTTYTKALLSCSGTVRGRPRIAVDYSNGTAAQVVNGLLEDLGVRFTTLNEDPDGSFPVHGPNPLDPRTHERLSWLIANDTYDMGVLFDADGDRAVFFDEMGSYIPPSHAGALMADYLFPDISHFRSIVATVSTSRMLDDIATAHEGRVYRSPVGRTEVMPLMKQKRAFLGVERSGHYFFKDFGYQDSAVRALSIMLEILTQKPRPPLSERRAALPRYSILPEINIPRNGTSEEAVFTAVRRAFPRGEVSEIDGLTLLYKDWWCNVRASNTEPVWRLSVEGKTLQFIEEKRAKLEAIIRGV